MVRNTIGSAIGCGLLLVFMTTTLSAQGFLIDPESRSGFRLPRPTPNQRDPGVIYDIAKLEIDASIRGQVAEVQVGQTFKNRTSRTLQVQFIFPLPYDGAIDQMTFLVDGEELEGRLLEADKAREIYQSYVRRNRDPALVQWIGTGMFQTQVFPVPPGAERTVSLRYTQICHRSGNLNDWTLPLSPAQFTSTPIGEVAIRGRIRSETELGNVYSPTHDIKIDRDGNNVARFEYITKNHIPKSDLRILWDTGDDSVQMSLVTYRPDQDQDGYFMLMIQPRLPAPDQGIKKEGKNVVLVLDKSGSMKGEKIEQARRAARHIIGKLKGRDRFTMIAYDSKVESYSSELTRADKVTRADATEYADSMLAGGSTNIDEALLNAFQLARDGDGPVYVVFMTDGQPTVGEKNSMKIAANAEREIHSGTRLFSLGVGHDVNSRLLDKLASICLGQTTYVRPGQPLDEAIKTLWSRIGAPAMTDAKLNIRVDGKEGRTRQLYPSDMYDLFSGDQLVIVGRYRKPGSVQVKLSGNYLGKSQTYTFSDKLPRRTGSGKNVFVERLWATRRIGQIIDDIDLNGEEQELVDELITLSKRHGILTPYTAYLAEEQTDLNNMSAGRQVARNSLRRLSEEAGRDAFQQRSIKGLMKSADRVAQLGDLDAPSAAPADSLGFSGQRPLRSRPANQSLSGGGMGGARGGSLGGAPGGAPSDGLATGAEMPQSGPAPVKRIGSKTFFLREGRYVDSEASEKQISDAIEIEQFSDKYFDLLDELDEDSKLYLAEEREILLVLNSKSYRITLAKTEEERTEK